MQVDENGDTYFNYGDTFKGNIDLKPNLLSNKQQQQADLEGATTPKGSALSGGEYAEEFRNRFKKTLGGKKRKSKKSKKTKGGRKSKKSKTSKKSKK